MDFPEEGLNVEDDPALFDVTFILEEQDAHPVAQSFAKLAETLGLAGDWFLRPLDPFEDVFDRTGHVILELLQKENAEIVADAVDFNVAAKLITTLLQAVSQLGLFSGISAVRREKPTIRREVDVETIRWAKLSIADTFVL